MNREESLGKRLLNYLGLEYEFREGFEPSGGAIRAIDVFLPSVKAEYKRYVVSHSSWHSLLFGCDGRFGFRDLRKWLADKDSPWYEYKLKAFRWENLDELEMQLSIRGF